MLIVGAGIFGTSTAYHLSEQSPSTKITVIDRTPSAPEHAASNDINKIIRQDYSSRFYMDLATEAMHAWATWPELKPLFHRTGWIAFNPAGSDTAALIRENFCARGDDPTRDMSMDEVRKAFGGIFAKSDLSEFDGAYGNPDAGWCDAAAATAAMMHEAVGRGVRYVTGDVARLVPGKGATIEAVETADGRRFSGDKVLLATGAWTSSLMSGLEDALGIPDEHRVERQAVAAGVAVAHYKLDDAEQAALKEMPVTVFGDNGDCQPPPPSCGLLKYTNSMSFTHTITTATGKRISVPPDGRSQRTIGKKLQDETHAVMTGKLMPQLTRGRPVDYWRLCWDAVTPEQDHLICRHERVANLYLALGGSFHSYKFLPTCGQYVVRVLHGESNGAEKDEHWAWKRGSSGRGAHASLVPQRELSEAEGV